MLGRSYTALGRYTDAAAALSQGAPCCPATPMACWPTWPTCWPWPRAGAGRRAGPLVQQALAPTRATSRRWRWPAAWPSRPRTTAARAYPLGAPAGGAADSRDGALGARQHRRGHASSKQGAAARPSPRRQPQPRHRLGGATAPAGGQARRRGGAEPRDGARVAAGDTVYRLCPRRRGAAHAAGHRQAARGAGRCASRSTTRWR
jgi:hypothetical protein